jgi:hypothetical protein
MIVTKSILRYGRPTQATHAMKRLCLAVVSLVVVLTAVRADTTLVFNEVMYHPATNEPALEWVELYNQMAVDLDVSGWSLTGNIGYTFPANSRIGGRSFIVVAINPAALLATMAQTNVVGPFTGRLNNANGTVRLRNNAGRLMDELNYGTDGNWPVGPDGGGVSLAKRDRDFGSAASANWTMSEQIGGTPGLDNFPGAGTPPVALVNIDSTWRYEASGTDLGTGWRAPGFDDSAWSQRHGLTNRAIPGLFNTGVDNNGAVLANGAADPHYILSYNANGASGIPATVSLNNAAWLANDTASKWISVIDNGANTIAGGGYGYQTTFSLTGFLLGTVRLDFMAAIDNAMTNVFLNGVAQNFTFAGFAGYSSTFTMNSGFNSGVNTLEFGTENQGAGPGAFRAVVSGSGLSLNTNSPLAVGPSTYYFRRSFNFFGNPQATLLMINPVVADGAVFYLNGVEVYRQNMPGGAVNYATPALSNVTTPAYAGTFAIAASNLVVGANVLAVEVHQAVGSADAAIFGTEVNYTPQSTPAIELAFNEHPGTTNGPAWVEVISYGSNWFRPSDFRIALNNPTNLIPNSGVLTWDIPFGIKRFELSTTNVSGDRLFLIDWASHRIVDAISLKRGPRARFPDGTGEWLVPNALTPDATNTFSFNNSVVINEIMYHHKVRPSVSSNTPPEANDEAWIELYNRSANPVNLTGWGFTDGIDYNFPSNKILAAGAYLIVAKDADKMRAEYPALDIVGDFDGNLSHSDDELVLSDAIGNPADEVHYRDGGRWPGYADGDGSSLELRDPNADNSKGEAWAASDESAKSGWQLVRYSAVAAPSVTANPDAQWRDFVFGLLGAGECLIDDLSVVQSPGGGSFQYVANGDFSAGLTGWRAIGTHGRSRVEPEPGNPGNNVLHVIATGPQEHMHNHIETTIANGRSVTNGQTYEISYRVKWLAGNGLMNTRLYFNRVARTTEIIAPQNNGTPGAINSRYATNIGPTFAGLQHSPVAPATNQPVTVSISAQDPNGVSSAQVFWSVNGGVFLTTNMTAGAGGVYSATVPGQTGGALVQFYVRATDGLGVVSTFPAAGAASGVFYKVADGLSNLPLAHNIRILMSPADTALLHANTNVMSNASLPCTVVYDERIAYYDMQVRLKSSQRGRLEPLRVGFHLDFPPEQPFRGVHPVMLVDRSGGGGRPTSEEIVVRHMLLKSGVQALNGDLIRVLAPQAAQNGPAIFVPRFEDEFSETAFTDNGGDGTFFELELIYYPTTANGAGYKIPNPDLVQGLDISDYGTFKENYRYNFIIKNNRDGDDYGPWMTFARPWALSGTTLDAQTQQMMDLDQWMKAYAMITLCGIGDMYTFGIEHNFMIYLRGDNHRAVYLPWDMDFSFTRANNAALVGNQNLGKIVSLPGNLRVFYAHILDQLDTTYNTAYMNYWLAHYGPFAGQSYTGNASYIQARGDFARATITGAGGLNPFTIASTNISISGSNLIILSGNAPVTVKTITINGQEYPVTWTSLTAWTVRVPVPPGGTNLTITTYNLNGQQLTNVIATATSSAVLDSPVGKLVINEIMYHPAVADSEYLELFNASTNTTFDLSGWQVNGLSYTFPSGSYILPQTFLVLAKNRSVFAFNYGNAIPVFDEFSGDFQNDGETISIIKPGATPALDLVVDAVRYEGALPWPAAAADGTGSSYQLTDYRQDNSRAGNWYARYIPPVYGPEISTPAVARDGWRFFSTTGSIGSGEGGMSNTYRLLLYLGEPGSALIDDLAIVSGTNPAVGPNFVRNGDFETPLDTEVTNSWKIGTNCYGDTFIASDLVHAGSGAFKIVGTNAAGIANHPIYTRSIMQVISPASVEGAPAINTINTMSFWYWATNSATNLYVRIRGSTALATGPLSGPTNINIFITPSNYVPAGLVSPATNSLTPGRTNDALAILPAFQPLWLNEVQAENTAGILDNNGEREPWVELYNSSTNTVSLEGLYLTHNYTNLTNWAFPPGSSIGPTQFLVIFCDGEAGETAGAQYHTSFRLPASSGGLALSRIHNAAPQVIDYLNYAGVHANRSYGSFPDGQSIERREFFYVTPGGTNDGSFPPATVFINELVAQNSGLLADPADGQFEDWFELYNPGTNAVDLAGYFLTDVLTNKTKFQITTNMAHIIPPGGYLLVWADNETGQNTVGGVPRPDMHVNFSLAVGGEEIGLYAPDGTLIDGVPFFTQITDVSSGRYPDGASTFYFMPGTATPRAANQIAQSENTAPVLDPIGNKIVFLGQTLAFTATATDSDAPAQTLTFTLDPVPPAGANITGAGAFTWTPAALGTNTMTIRVTDNGTPALADSETITVEVLAAPSFTSSLRNGDNVELTWRTRSGKKYAVDYKNDLNALSWTPLWTNTALGDSLSFTNAATNSPQRFFRIRTVD